MQRAKDFAILGLLLSAAALCGFLCWGIFAEVQVSRSSAKQANETMASIKATSDSVRQTSDFIHSEVVSMAPNIEAIVRNLNQSSLNIQSATKELSASAAEINRKCPPGAAEDDDATCGTLANLNKAIHSIRFAAGQVTAVSMKEREQLKKANTQETDIAKATTDAINSFSDAGKKLGAAAQSLSDLASNKDIARGAKNMADFTEYSADAMKEGAEAIHRFFHPKWPVRLYGYIKDSAVTAGKIFIP